MTLLHHFRVSLRALSTRPSFSKSLSPHCLEDLVSGEQSKVPVPEHPSLSKTSVSSTGKIMLPVLILRRIRPPVKLVGLSTSPQGVQSILALLLAGPV